VNAGPKGPRGAALYAALKGRLFQNGRRVLDGEKVPLFHFVVWVRRAREAVNGGA
jgi:hypothetical protein